MWVMHLAFTATLGERNTQVNINPQMLNDVLLYVQIANGNMRFLIQNWNTLKPWAQVADSHCWPAPGSKVALTINQGKIRPTC